ncbi:3-isopropylmalate dehydratase large subunit [Striga asiatica]|uniref:3-isopropylmalate dehydratase large subunit n=1 Tax=Striga asiatica TaxID=4170 RepID=A0A5A7QYD1_STRAF|nr:3-isopropylmalate dehydratase large subunit [Striga asiatica]
MPFASAGELSPTRSLSLRPPMKSTTLSFSPFDGSPSHGSFKIFDPISANRSRADPIHLRRAAARLVQLGVEDEQGLPREGRARSCGRLFKSAASFRVTVTPSTTVPKTSPQLQPLVFEMLDRIKPLVVAALGRAKQTTAARKQRRRSSRHATLEKLPRCSILCYRCLTDRVPTAFGRSQRPTTSATHKPEGTGTQSCAHFYLTLHSHRHHHETLIRHFSSHLLRPQVALVPPPLLVYAQLQFSSPLLYLSLYPPTGSLLSPESH